MSCCSLLGVDHCRLCAAMAEGKTRHLPCRSTQEYYHAPTNNDCDKNYASLTNVKPKFHFFVCILIHPRAFHISHVRLVIPCRTMLPCPCMHLLHKLPQKPASAQEAIHTHLLPPIAITQVKHISYRIPFLSSIYRMSSWRGTMSISLPLHHANIKHLFFFSRVAFLNWKNPAPCACTEEQKQNVAQDRFLLVGKMWKRTCHEP